MFSVAAFPLPTLDSTLNKRCLPLSNSNQDFGFRVVKLQCFREVGDRKTH